MGEVAEFPNDAVALERLRILARSLAREATDLTAMTFAVPVNRIAIHAKLTAIEAAVLHAKMDAL